MTEPSPLNSTGSTICHVLHTMDVGGAEVLAREFAEHARARYRVVFACLDSLGVQGARLRDQGYTIEVMNRRAGLDLRCAWKLSRFFRRERVGVIHAHQYAPFFYSAVSRWLGHRTPILFTEHGRDYPDYPRPKRMRANRMLLRRGDRVVAVGEQVKQALVRNEGLPADRIQVIYNGIDLSRYDARRPDRQAVRDELRIDENDQVIMQVARLHRLKDHATGLRAMARLVETCPQARLVLVGDGDERGMLEQLIVDLQLQPFVRLLGTRRDVARLLQAADVFLLTSITEGIALTLIEAMATGLPCVATQVGGNPELLNDASWSRLVPAQDPESLASALRDVLHDSQVKAISTERGPRRAGELFDAAAMHRAYMQLYETML